VHSVLHALLIPQLAHSPVSAAQALTIMYYSNTPELVMDDREIESKLDHLVNLQTLMVTSGQLHRVPWLTNMQSLLMLHLTNNRITTIAPGDFKGATRLVELQLSGNKIVSAAPQAFANLRAFNMPPEDFNPVDLLNKTYVRPVGFGRPRSPASVHLGARA